jgi:hypothetical protein
MVRRLADTEVGPGRARARESLRWGEEPLGVRLRHRKPAYRDLELDDDGETIWAACLCDKVDGNPAKALVKLDTEGNHDTSWLTHAGTGAFGQSVVDHNGKLYLAAGGSDFAAEYDKAEGGTRRWVRDTSGSAQAIAVYDGQLVVGGHFYYVGDIDPISVGPGVQGSLGSIQTESASGGRA